MHKSIEDSQQPQEGVRVLSKGKTRYHADGPRYAEISGDVRYGTMDQQEAEQYRGQIVMNTEEEVRPFSPREAHKTQNAPIFRALD